MDKAIKFQRILGGRAWMPLGQLRISRRTRTTATAVAAFAAISMLAVALAMPAKMMADDDDFRTFTVDVAFRDPVYQNNVDPAKGAEVFSQGDTFIQYGTIFPGGTIPEGKTDFDPDKAPGAIGVYLARGTLITDSDNFMRAEAGDSTADSDLAFMTEIFSFNNNHGTIMTEGIMPNAHFSAHRIVLGGTRKYRDIVGEVREDNIGEHSTNSYCNLQVTFKIRRVGEGGGR